MSIAMPKHQAKEPIDLDIILVCRKLKAFSTGAQPNRSWSSVALTSSAQVQRFRQAGRQLSRNDIRVIVTAQALRYFSEFNDSVAAVDALSGQLGDLEVLIDQLHGTPSVSTASKG